MYDKHLKIDLKNNIRLAQAETGTPTGETHTGAKAEAPSNPLTQHSPFQYSLSGLFVATLLVVSSFLLTRNLSKIPGKAQAFVEHAVQWFTNFVVSVTGPKGKPFIPLVATLFLFIFCSNFLGALPIVFNQEGKEIGPAFFLVGPMANISMTFALALIVFIVVQVVALREQGLKGRLAHLAGDVPIWLKPLIFTLEVIGELIRPLSLSIRLFGNIFGEEMVLGAILALIAFLPVPFSLIPLHTPIILFGALTAWVQAFVFSLLTCVYLRLAIEAGEHGEHGQAHHEHDMHGDHAHGNETAAVPAH